MSKLLVEHSLNLTKFKCPLPLIKTKMALKQLREGQLLVVTTTDSGSIRDIPKFIDHSTHRMIKVEKNGSVVKFIIKVGSAE